MTTEPVQDAESVALADAARRYVKGILHADLDDAAVLRRAAKWSCDGWQAVARLVGLDFVPTRQTMIEAVTHLTQIDGVEHG